MSLGALEPKFWQAWCRGVGREDLVAMQFERPGSEAHAQVQEIFKTRTRAEWEAFARKHDCCLEPVLELDEALDSELVREREMVVELEQPGAERPVRQLGDPGEADAHAGRARAAAGAGAGRAHRGGAAGGGLLARAGGRAAGVRRGGGPDGEELDPHPPRRSGHERGRETMSAAAPLAGDSSARPELLKMSELAQRSGVSPGTIRYYLREGLLGEGERHRAHLAATWRTTHRSTWSGSS